MGLKLEIHKISWGLTGVPNCLRILEEWKGGKGEGRNKRGSQGRGLKGRRWEGEKPTKFESFC